MKLIFCFIAFVISIASVAQDTCCTVKSAAAQDDDGFAVNPRRLDSNHRSFLKTLNLESYHFVTDYVGSLRNPGALFNELDFSSYELLNVNLTFTDKNNAQKIVFAPFRLIDDLKSTLITNTKFNIAQKNNITTLGIGTGGDNSDPRTARSVDIRNNVFSKGVYCIPECYATKKEQDDHRISNQVIASNLLYAYDMQRTKNVFKWSVGYNIQFFSVLSSKGDDLITDSVNFYATKSHNGSIAGSYSRSNGRIVVNAGYNYIMSRKSAEKGQKQIPYHGLQTSTSFRLISFLKGKKLHTNENFIKSLYVPSLNIGLGYEYKFTNGDIKDVEDGIKRSRVVTPYLDILLTPASQFRIALPITKNATVIDKKSLLVGALLQYGFKLSSL